MRTMAGARLRWNATFASNANIQDLRAAVRRKPEENPCNNGLRSVCWKAFLLFENLDRSTWSKTLFDAREAFAALKRHFLKDLENPDDLSAADPLADDEFSPWNILRRDEILREEIYQDVERCMPDNLYFREPTTRSMLLDILFIFCKLNADIGYRQGMHEILAPILWVVSRDAIDPTSLESHEGETAQADVLLRATLDHSFVEHDAFTIFCIVMQTARSFYETSSNPSHPSPSSSSHSSPIVERSKRIHENYLRKVDPELTNHLTSIEVLPQIFVIRWIRLLYGREFPFEDVLRLWDVIFAEDPTLDLVDFICVAMLLRIRWQLMDSDYSSALTLLLRYPVPSHPHGPPTFVDDAVFLQHNLTLEGGARIIKRYSNRSPRFSVPDKDTDHRKNPANSSPLAPSPISITPRSPLLSAGRFLQEQGGIEGILQEAARGVYTRGEKWGVNKALRGAVQGLQSGNSSPRRPLSGVRWSLDEGKTVSVNNEHLTSRIKALEERNKALAKILENAMTELAIQQQAFEKEKAESLSDAVSLAIAKMQFVQVYLEDSSMPLFSETANPSESADTAKVATPEQDAAPTESTESSQIEGGTNPTITVSATPSKDPATLPHPHTQDIPTEPSASSTNSDLSTRPPKPKPLPSPFHHSRPSLAQSSFSWLMGEDQRKSSFVSASPMLPESKREKSTGRAKAGFLFGDDKVEGKGAVPGMMKTKGKGKGKGGEEEEARGFSLGSLGVSSEK